VALSSAKRIFSSGNLILSPIIDAFSYVCDHKQGHGMLASIAMNSCCFQKRSPALAEAGDRRQADDGKGGQPAFCRCILYRDITS